MHHTHYDKVNKLITRTIYLSLEDVSLCDLICYFLHNILIINYCISLCNYRITSQPIAMSSTSRISGQSRASSQSGSSMQTGNAPLMSSQYLHMVTLPAERNHDNHDPSISTQERSHSDRHPDNPRGQSEVALMSWSEEIESTACTDRGRVAR